MTMNEHDEPADTVIDDPFLATLAGRLFRPQRAALEIVHETISGIDDPERAWQLLGEKELIPAELVAAPSRCFGMIDTSRRRPYARAEGEARHAYPPHITAVETLAADTSGMLEAECLGRELARRLIPWGGPEISSFEWFCLSHERPLSSDMGYPFDCAYNSLEYALDEAGHVLDELRPDDERLPRFANDLVRAHLGWKIAVDEELEVPSAYWPPSAVKWHLYGELENPFATALELLRTGYRLDAIRQDEPVLRFYAFCVGAPHARRPGRPG